jgi:xylono-1,5-lactonase
MWLDLLNVQLFVHNPGSGETEHHALQLQSPLGALVATTDPNTVMVSHRCGIVTYDIRNQVVAPFSDPEAGRDAVAYNDGKVDRYGRLWVGTSHLDEREARGALWCVEPDGTGTLGDAGFVVSNGPAFSPDGSKLYFNDTLARKLFSTTFQQPIPTLATAKFL